MKALVTGGAGFIGSHLVDRLLAEGYEVRILDNLEPRVHPNGKPAWIPNEAEFVQGDVRDPGALSRALNEVQVVFHEAAYQDYMLDFSKFLHVNSVSAALIHELILRNNREIKAKGKSVEKVIVASSQAVYGEGQYQCLNNDCEIFNQVIQMANRESTQLEKGQWEIICPRCGQEMHNQLLSEAYHNPYNAYAISKLAEEMTAVRLGKLHGVPTVALRYSIVQGARQSLFNQYSGICRIFCLRLLNDLPPIIYEDGLQKRDYTHIKDVVDASITVLEDPRANYQVYNVGSGMEITVMEYARLLAKRLGKDLEPLIPGEYRIGDNRHSVSDISKLRELGWKPMRNLDHIFQDYLEWIQEQRDIREFFHEAEHAMREQGVVRQVKKEKDCISKKRRNPLE